MGWKNCTNCGFYYKEGGSGCTNLTCLLAGKGDDKQRPVSTSTKPAVMAKAAVAVPRKGSVSPVRTPPAVSKPLTVTTPTFPLVSTPEQMTLYRADDREPQDIKKAGRFYPKKPRTLEEVKGEVARFLAKSPQDITMHVRSPQPELVSTGTDEECGGTQKKYYYKIEFKNFRVRDIDEKTVENPIKAKRNAWWPEFYMDNATIQQAKMIALRPPQTQELTFFTMIPWDNIVGCRADGEKEWTAPADWLAKKDQEDVKDLVRPRDGDVAKRTKGKDSPNLSTAQQMH